MEMAVFALFALLALGSSVVVIAHRSPIYSTLSLVLTLFSVAVLWKLFFNQFVSGMALWTFLVTDDRFSPLARSLGIPHSRVVLGVFALNLVLGMLAWVMVRQPSKWSLALSAAAVILVGTYYLIERRAPMRRRAVSE